MGSAEQIGQERFIGGGGSMNLRKADQPRMDTDRHGCRTLCGRPDVALGLDLVFIRVYPCSSVVASSSARRRRRNRGFVLVAVLVVILLVSMVAASLMFRVRAEETAVAAGAGSEQAWAAAMSGVYEAIHLVQQSAPGEIDWQDAPQILRERLAFDDGADRWYFSVYTDGGPDRQEVRFGLTDEASKLNLNHATEAMLAKLPRVTPYLAQGLLDFIDRDNTPRAEGAEQEYYDSLAHPYTVLNGPLSTLEELLLVRGFTPAVLYGEDANLNFQLDGNEDDGDEQFPPDNG